ncbi:MAG: protein TolQ [Kiloniellales bacterium]|jgi:biopolymer transport protein TolQ
MEQTAVDTTTLGDSAVYDLSIWGLFTQADIVVQAVLVMLLLASFWTWAIIFDKWLRIRRLKARAESFEEDFWSGGSLDDLYEQINQRPSDPMSAIFVSAMKEWRRSTTRGAVAGEHSRASLQQRIERVMDITLGREMQRLERQMIFLASVGSSAPFVGLFGTVWGIMNAFTSIAATKNTTLAVVAPGIAEALFATALGLVAAIPAVIGFNKLSTDLGRYSGRLDAFAGEFSAILSRQLEEAR